MKKSTVSISKYANNNTIRDSKSVLVIGDGAGAIFSSLNLASMGYDVYLLTGENGLGGKIGKINTLDEQEVVCKNTDDQWPHVCSNPCSCLTKKIKQVEEHQKIQIIYNAVVASFSGFSGNFNVGVNSNDAIINLKVGAIVLAFGYNSPDKKVCGEYGYGHYANVITSVDLEEVVRLDEGREGEIFRPSNKKKPKKVAFIQCVGSRDCRKGADYCSSICCMCSIKEAIVLKEKSPNVEITIFYLDIRTHGKYFEQLLIKAQQLGIKFVRAMVSNVKEDPQTNNLFLYYYRDQVKIEDFEMVVLATGLQPDKKSKQVAKLMGVKLTENGFMEVENGGHLASNVSGIYGIGAFLAPKTMPEIIIEAGAVAAIVNAELKIKRSLADKKPVLVVGGGVGGLTAATTLAAQGLPVIVVEQGNRLGGKLSDISIKTEGFDYLDYLSKLIRDTMSNPYITIMLNTELLSVKGENGNLNSTFAVREKKNHLGKVKTINHSALILAIGGDNEPVLKELPKHQAIIECSQLEQKWNMSGNQWVYNQVVFIQCNITGKSPAFCKRTCCLQSVLNAIKLKEINPAIAVTIIYRNLRTFGLWEKIYTKARVLGIVFLQLEPEYDVEIREEEEDILIDVFDTTIKEQMILKPDLLVVADGVKPRSNLGHLAEMLEVKLDRFGFMKEAHAKWHPLETDYSGIYVCGSAVAPTLVSETIMQAKSVAGLAAKTITENADGDTNIPKKCDNCLTCTPCVQSELP